MNTISLSRYFTSLFQFAIYTPTEYIKIHSLPIKGTIALIFSGLTKCEKKPFLILHVVHIYLKVSTQIIKERMTVLRTKVL